MSKYCPKCGNELPDDAQFCNECGYSVLVDDNSPVKETPKKVQKTEETETSKKDIDELLFNKLRLKLNPTTIWIPKYSAAKLHLISLKIKY